MHLFQRGHFVLHSGGVARWKIECDSLTPADWAALALMAVERLPPFSAVEGVPRGGLPFARALQPYAGAVGGLLVCDDVGTTGNSLEKHRAGRDAIGVVAFARGVCPAWVVPLWTLAPLPEAEEAA